VPDRRLLQMTAPDRLKPGLYPVDSVVRIETPEAPPALRPAGELPVETGELAPASLRARRRARPGRYFAMSVRLFVVAAVSVQAGFFVADMFDRNVVLGAGFSALIGLAGASLLWWIGAELRQFRRLEAVDRLREEATLLLDSQGHDQAARFIA